MKNNTLPTHQDYIEWIGELGKRYRQSQFKAAVKVNEELILFYLGLGRDIVERNMENTYGSGFYASLSRDLQKQLPNATGLSETNIRYAKRCYSLYNKIVENLPQVVADFSNEKHLQSVGTLNNVKETQPVTLLDDNVSTHIMTDLCRIPWGHHRAIYDKVKGNADEALFYVRKTLENGWSRAMLLNMMDTKLYESQGESINNFSTVLPSPESDYARQITKDPYNFNFLTLGEDYRERELQKALEENIARFLMELGNGFAFVGRQVRLEVNGDEFFCDLLFYHIHLKRYVVVELKTVKFEPEFISKVNFYCNAVNHLMKREDDNDTIGLLICKEKNDVVAQWTVENAPVPIAISKYILNNIIPVAARNTKCREKNM